MAIWVSLTDENRLVRSIKVNYNNTITDVKAVFDCRNQTRYTVFPGNPYICDIVPVCCRFNIPTRTGIRTDVYVGLQFNVCWYKLEKEQTCIDFRILTNDVLNSYTSDITENNKTGADIRPQTAGFVDLVLDNTSLTCYKSFYVDDQYTCCCYVAYFRILTENEVPKSCCFFTVEVLWPALYHPATLCLNKIWFYITDKGFGDLGSNYSAYVHNTCQEFDADHIRIQLADVCDISCSWTECSLYFCEYFCLFWKNSNDFPANKFCIFFTKTFICLCDGTTWVKTDSYSINSIDTASCYHTCLYTACSSTVKVCDLDICLVAVDSYNRLSCCVHYIYYHINRDLCYNIGELSTIAGCVPIFITLWPEPGYWRYYNNKLYMPLFYCANIDETLENPYGNYSYICMADVLFKYSYVACIYNGPVIGAGTKCVYIKSSDWCYDGRIWCSPSTGGPNVVFDFSVYKTDIQWANTWVYFTFNAQFAVGNCWYGSLTDLASYNNYLGPPTYRPWYVQQLAVRLDNCSVDRDLKALICFSSIPIC